MFLPSCFTDDADNYREVADTRRKKAPLGLQAGAQSGKRRKEEKSLNLPMKSLVAPALYSRTHTLHNNMLRKKRHHNGQK
jgi:hypothetical protein